MMSYLALTAHWIATDGSSERLKLRSALIGFHRLKDSHTGINIAKAILHLLDRANVTLKVWVLYAIASISDLSLDRPLHTR